MRILKRAVQMYHEVIRGILNEGDIAVDCTAGNGNDTAFLAELVGEKGKVYGFDIQEQAIENTRNKLTNLGLIDSVELIHDSHENLRKYVKGSIKAAVYNLGYLPRGDHSLITKPQSTIKSLKEILELLVPGGIAAIAIYYGHEGGDEEKDCVLEFVSKLDQKKFAVQKMEFVNLINCPPILVCIEREEEK